MQRIDVRVRAPTASAWVASAVAVVLTGELYDEMRKSPVVRLFNVPFSREEMAIAVGVLAVAAAACLLWLALLYLRPGRLRIDVAQQTIERRLRQRFRERVVRAPAGDWRAHVVYFSSSEQSRGTFKRLALSCSSDGPGFQEVLLFTDVDRATDLLRGLDSLRDALGAYEVEIQSAAR